MQKRRPVYLNLLKIKFPASGMVSILHRASGLLLFLAIPLLLLALDRSLASLEGFDSLAMDGHGWLSRLVVGAVLWGFLHHLFAGLRFLSLDVHRGIHLPQARFSARLVLLASALSGVALALWLW